jgi:carbon starvation protein
MMLPPLFANLFYETAGDRTILRAMPIMLGVLCVLAIAYRYYSAFLAAKVAALDDSRVTPAHRFYDGQNYHPTNKWVLFGHHFAAISGAGPLIGPVLAIQYGYMPGLLWLLVGVCLAGAVQDMLVLAASVRRDGKSLAEIARAELGRPAAAVVSAAILFIVIIALAGLGSVVVKALGGDATKFADGTRITLPRESAFEKDEQKSDRKNTVFRFPQGCLLRDGKDDLETFVLSDSFFVQAPRDAEVESKGPNPLLVLSAVMQCAPGNPMATLAVPAQLPGGPLALPEHELPKQSVEIVPGSSWGLFTIACTVPIALFVGLYMYKIRKGRVVEASLLGAAGVLAGVIVGNYIPGSPFEPYFSLSKGATIWALCGYGFIASVLPVWLLLCPRDYLSSFLKIGTIALIVVGVLLANPPLTCPTINPVFKGGSPTFPAGGIFPFVFICIMCGSISGFHALVSSGTTPKMIDKESQVRMIGYGAMLMEGLVGIVALIAAASLDVRLYYDINVDRSQVKKYRERLGELYATLGAADSLTHLRPEKHDIAQVNRMVGGGESLRGRTGGAVTLAVGMALIFDDALAWTGWNSEGIIKYWYHFAIMFEALFILTTIDTGTRIARFLLQEALGKLHPKFEQTDWLPGAALATLIVTAGWGGLVATGSIETIWPMFGIANQLLAVIALSLVTTLLVNRGKAKYAWVTLLPMAFVTATTMTAGYQLIDFWSVALLPNPATAAMGVLNIAFSVFIITSVITLLLIAASNWLTTLRFGPTGKNAVS